MRKKNQNKIQAICSIAGLLFVAFIFAACLSEEEPTPIEQEDLETGRVVWSEAPAAVEDPDEIKIIFDADGIPTATTAPTATSTPTTAADPTPTETPAPTATSTPAAPKVTLSRGIPGTYKTPADGTHTWKPWAWYTAITATESPQWRLQQLATTDENGLRVVTDPAGVARYCIAMEPAWAGGTSKDIGRCVDLVMQSGEILHCVLADTKKVENSKDRAGVYGKHGELAEFLVDGTKLNPAAKRSGTVSSIGGAFAEEATEVRVLDMFIAGFGG